MTTPDAVKTASEWRAGGKMLFAATVCYCCMSMPLTGLGVMIKPLSELYGWSRAAITSVVLITALGTMLIAPLVGHIVDRIGPRRVGLVGLWLLGAGIAGIGFAGPSITSWYIAWTVYAVLQPAAGNVVWASAITGRFDRHRGLALAVLLSGLSVVASLLPMIALATMNLFGWRPVFFLLGGFTVTVAWPLAWLWFYGTHDLRPDKSVRADPLPGHTLAEALRTRQFWQIAAIGMLVAAAVAALYVHLQPILSDAGLSRETAALVAVVIGPAAMAGRFASGFMLDRLPAPLVATLVLMLPGISHALIYFNPSSVPLALVCAITLGAAHGAESDLLAFLASRYFGLRAFSVIYGLLLGVFSVGYGIGPLLAGKSFDQFGTYAPVFAAMMGAAALGAVLSATLGRYPRFTT